MGRRFGIKVTVYSPGPRCGAEHMMVFAINRWGDIVMTEHGAVHWEGNERCVLAKGHVGKHQDKDGHRYG